ncbi:MAG: hypothetical protein ACRENP_03320 [Longimicrobiales bacterium]
MYAAMIPSKIDQSVIVEGLYFYAIDEHFPGIVLTPACDFEQGKVELATACALISAWDLLSQLLRTDWQKDGLIDQSGSPVLRSSLSAGKTKWFKGQVRSVARQQFPRYHWLPPPPGTKVPLIADFQILACVPVDEIRAVTPIAALLSPFREQLPTRYAAYVGRIGTPDAEAEVIESWLGAAVAAIFPSNSS